MAFLQLTTSTIQFSSLGGIPLCPKFSHCFFLRFRLLWLFISRVYIPISSSSLSSLSHSHWIHLVALFPFIIFPILLPFPTPHFHIAFPPFLFDLSLLSGAFSSSFFVLSSFWLSLQFQLWSFGFESINCQRVSTQIKRVSLYLTSRCFHPLITYYL